MLIGNLGRTYILYRSFTSSFLNVAVHGQKRLFALNFIQGRSFTFNFIQFIQEGSFT